MSNTIGAWLEEGRSWLSFVPFYTAKGVEEMFKNRGWQQIRCQVLAAAMVLIFVSIGYGEDRFVVVLDPGHGGGDAGVIGSYGAREKDVTLALALEVRRQLGHSFDIRLTRESDRGLSLTRRTELANSFHGDLLISLHGGGGHSRDANYMTIFVQQEKNGRLISPGGDSWDGMHRSYIQESHALASVLKGFLSTIDGYDGVSGSGVPLRVARGAAMPVVLIEVGNLTNPREEGRLETPHHLRRVAVAVAEGIEMFLSR